MYANGWLHKYRSRSDTPDDMIYARQSRSVTMSLSLCTRNRHKFFCKTLPSIIASDIESSQEKQIVNNQSPVSHSSRLISREVEMEDFMYHDDDSEEEVSV